MPRTIAIGDIHGCRQTLQALLHDVVRITRDDVLVFIGDYIDRGPDSKGVVDDILKLRSDGFKLHTLRGNHEQLFLDSAHDEDDRYDFLVNGGRQTLEQFGFNGFEDLTDVYKQFFSNTLLHYKTDHAWFVHGALDLDADDPFDDHETILWGRMTTGDLSVLNERKLIHGHTPLPLERMLSQKGPVINIDAGCVYPDRDGMGHLAAYIVETGEFYFSPFAD